MQVSSENAGSGRMYHFMLPDKVVLPPRSCNIGFFFRSFTWGNLKVCIRTGLARLCCSNFICWAWLVHLPQMNLHTCEVNIPPLSSLEVDICSSWIRSMRFLKSLTRISTYWGSPDNNWEPSVVGSNMPVKWRTLDSPRRCHLIHWFSISCLTFSSELNIHFLYPPSFRISDIRKSHYTIYAYPGPPKWVARTFPPRKGICWAAATEHRQGKSRF